ncbi:large-conductance mechanosensitive channel protein MscL [Paenibacillus sp. HB172176]|uniref:large-conductance mechanosensitive channel protein MscL n=1 Tax=Paenibacillus sp. HB172176 TaxID=2493690 RepID=UPI00143A04D0|nr:large-conductance mechanosensitive channel protein MscL [Paenibacillus sp. HB172176]
MGIMKEFKTFAMRGNVVDLAVGVIIGGAFGKIVTSLVNDIIMPPIGKLLGDVSFEELTIPLVDMSKLTEEEQAVAPVIRYGQFINVVLDFLIVAFCIFLLVKVINRLKHKEEKKEEAPKAPTEKECPYCLSQIPIHATRCKNCTSHLVKVEHS